MKKIIDKLDDNKKYECQLDMVYFLNKGNIKSGKWIKKNIPYDISPNQPISDFFKEVS